MRLFLSERQYRSGFGGLVVAGRCAAVGRAFGQPAPSAQHAAAPQADRRRAHNAAAAKLEFDVASVRPSAPLDMQKMAADMQAGKMPRMGAHVDGLLAEYNYMSLKDLVAAAYKVKDYQITCPDWMGTARFDISARMPEGSSKDDAPKMLQALLADRFKLVIHRETQDHPVLALVVGKDGPKLKDISRAACADRRRRAAGQGRDEDGRAGRVQSASPRTPTAPSLRIWGKRVLPPSRWTAR